MTPSITIHETIHEVALAGLLHDIGKLMQRADVPLSLEGQRMQQLSDTYAHVHYTHDFFQNHLTHFLPPGINLITTEHLAASHHDQNCDGCALLIQLADRASSAFDRLDSAAPGAGWKSQRLLAPFADIALDPATPPVPEFSRLQPLAFNSTALFPEPDPKPADRTPDYQQLWQAFLAALPLLNSSQRDPNLWLAAFASLLERFTWCIPSYTQSNLADISLYDHSLTTAGIAAALFRYHELTQSWSEQTLRDINSPRLRIISADLSGIQHFIQNIPSFSASHRKHFHRHLRARSFVIGMITDVVFHKLCVALALPRVCAWLRHGGRLTFLAPNVPLVDDAIRDIQSEMDAWLLSTFFGELRLHLDASVCLALKDFSRSQFPALLRSVAAGLQRHKHTPFASQLRTTSGWNTASFCIRAEADQHSPYEETDALPYDAIARCLVQPRLVINYLPPQARSTFAIAGLPIDLSAEAAPDALYAEAVNDWSRGLPATCIANYVYLKDNLPASFDQLASVKKDGEHGTLLLLKGDVDDLGALFGFSRPADSLSRFLFRSRMLHYFFAGYLPHLMANTYLHSYTVYAGGDDFVILARLHSGLRFLRHAYEDFRRFTSQRLTFSAAAAPYKTNTPLRSAFRLAEAWLTDNAKAVENKNRVAAYHTIVSWDVLAHVLSTETELQKLLQQECINAGFLQRLLCYADMHAQATRGAKLSIAGFLYKPRMAYDIARNVAKNLDRDKRREVQDHLKTLLNGNNVLDQDTFMNALRIPVSSLIYQHRSSR